MSYVALYRKFRPQTFARVMGQDHVVRTLENQIKNNRIGHAYLFTGTRGTGKTSVAKIFARAVNCLKSEGGEPCNVCENCRSALAGTFMDIVEIDAASNTGVDDIRRIIEEIQYTPAVGKYKVYIIDEAHMLSGSAFNAFLKTLEEPPSYVIFILATTEPNKLPITILSRCQRFDFRRIDAKTISRNLEFLTDQEAVPADEKALSYISVLADGSMRDAISLLDKCIAFNPGEKLNYENVLQTLGTAEVEIFSELFRAVSGSDASCAIRIVDRAVAEGRDLSRFVTDFIRYIRNLLISCFGGGCDITGVSPDDMPLIERDAKQSNPDVLMRYIRILSALLNEMRFSQAKQILTEVAVIKLAKPMMETDYESLVDRIRQLEEKADSLKPASDKDNINCVEEAPIAKTRPVEEFSKDSPADKVCASWADILDKQDDISLRFSFRKFVPRRVSDNVVSIDIKPGSFHEKLFLKADVRDKLKEAASEIAGGEVDIVINSEGC